MTLLRCPKCRALMGQRDAVGHYGGKLFLFHCPECSGTWVDGDVVLRVSRDSAVKVESDVEFDEITTEPREAAAFCPRCETHLMEQTGGGLPKGLHIDYCTGCHGFWFDKGELMIYKTYLEKKRQQTRQRLKQNEAKRKAQRERRERLRRRAGVSADIPVYHAGRTYRAVVANLFFDL
ncbi:MAG: zf-TFIIB domain-containing protein [Candidatus Hydrogenedentota bacterium]|nr:MAG: zf-TFIIB domain-containing protein [Candidatus Hydrogenedentota bacterium]